MSAAKHTPGPWEWFMQNGRPYLATPDRGRLYVMGFHRSGMQGATPAFSHWAGIDDGAERGRSGGVMCDGVLLKDGRLHPDARLIAAAPTTASMAMDFTMLVERFVRDGSVPESELADAMYALRAHIAKATGSAS